MDLATFEGATLPRHTVVMERGPVTNFAASLTDANPVHHRSDAARTAGHDGIPAVPTWPLAMQHWGAFAERQSAVAAEEDPMWTFIDGLLADGGLILHGEQEFIYRRPILVGDVLTSTGMMQDIRVKDTSSGGRMTFANVVTQWHDESGDLVVTEIRTIIHKI